MFTLCIPWTGVKAAWNPDVSISVTGKFQHKPSSPGSRWEKSLLAVAATARKARSTEFVVKAGPSSSIKGTMAPRACFFFSLGSHHLVLDRGRVTRSAQKSRVIRLQLSGWITKKVNPGKLESAREMIERKELGKTNLDSYLLAFGHTLDLCMLGFYHKHHNTDFENWINSYVTI